MDADRKKEIEARLAKICSLNRGRLTPDAVVADAKSPESPLHDQFEWDDSAAANQYRLDQARSLIRTMRIEVTTESRTVSTVRYVRDPSAGEEQGYVEVTKLKDDRALARDALLAELVALNARFVRAHSLADALGLSAEFVELRDRVESLRERITRAA